MSFSVILKDPFHSSEKAAEFLAGELGIPKDDAAEAYKTHPGFLLGGAGLEKASAFNRKASAAGFATALVDDSDLAALPPAVPVSKLEFSVSWLYFFAAGARQRLPLESLRLLAVNAVDLELAPNEPLHHEATLFESIRNKYFPFRIPVKLTGAPQPSPDVRTKDTVFTADLLTNGPQAVRLNWTYDAFDYSGLGAKKTYSSLENLRLLLAGIAALAFNAGKNRLLAAFLKKEPLAPFRNPTAAAYEKELRWLLTI